MSIAATLLALKEYRKVATVVVCAVVAAAFYIQWQSAKDAAAKASADRASLIAAADGTCLALNSQFRPDGVRREQWGMACLNEARRLGRIEGDLAKGDAAALIAALDERMGKEAADAALAAVMSERAAEAVARMEAADAAVENDRVGAGWACAVNDLGGLRAPGC
ncbi:hypothetical protein [Brevundimonas sp.]|uniref:hypothetical protein n=1 Tax=Brevundimonas sp. TaxID=1871086 RepID=UPI00289FC04A|nr:hypothetical protein [Brevundimonas sp.]